VLAPKNVFRTAFSYRFLTPHNMQLTSVHLYLHTCLLPPFCPQTSTSARRPHAALMPTAPMCQQARLPAAAGRASAATGRHAAVRHACWGYEACAALGTASNIHVGVLGSP
jgi:hypothetical protein